MLSAYPACFIKEENGYSVIFPDLNNLATWAIEKKASMKKWKDSQNKKYVFSKTKTQKFLCMLVKERWGIMDFGNGRI